MIVIPTAFALIATGVVPAVSHVPEASAAITASGFSSTATPGVEGGVLMFARQDDGSLYNYLYGKTGFNTRLEFFFDEAAPNYIRIYPDAGVDLSEVKVAKANWKTARNAEYPATVKEPIFAPDGSLTFVFEPDASAKSIILDLFDPAGTLVTNQSSGVRSLGTLNAEKVEIAKGTVEIPEIADSYSPAGRTLTRTQGAALPSAEEFVNTNGLPQGTTYSFVNRPSTANVGSFDFQVKVAYSDGSEDLVDATLVVTAKQTMADLNTPEGRTIVIPSGATTDAKDGIYNATDLPAGTTFEGRAAWTHPSRALSTRS